MAISVFDLFKIGIGPSSSHTMGPMRAARRFVGGLQDSGALAQLVSVDIELYGSLAQTGIGHGTDKAVQLGLMGALPETVDPDQIAPSLEKVLDRGSITLWGDVDVPFTAKENIKFFRRKTLPYHPNGMRYVAFGSDGEQLLSRTYYSIGGGFVVDEESAGRDRLKESQARLPFAFSSGVELLEICKATGKTMAQIMWQNETSWRNDQQIAAGLREIWDAMQACMDRGCQQEGYLPGHLKIKRRAPGLYRSLSSNPEASLRDPLNIIDWVNLYALAVNEENACGARVVTAPTNGAAGIIPAVLRYFERFCPEANEERTFDFLMTSAAIGILYAENASISGAEVGCQGEVGVACSMAAAGLVAARGGSPVQVEQAAEIGMEHNLGLTCDPIGGLVQIPCIERNAMGAVKAINAARIALRGDGSHHVSLDSVIETMRQTGADMRTKYKETSRGGLAVNVTEC